MIKTTRATLRGKGHPGPESQRRRNPHLLRRTSGATWRAAGTCQATTVEVALCTLSETTMTMLGGQQVASVEVDVAAEAQVALQVVFASTAKNQAI